MVKFEQNRIVQTTQNLSFLILKNKTKQNKNKTKQNRKHIFEPYLIKH